MDTRRYRAYRTLGLQPGAAPEEVRQAHRDLAQVWHPDRFGDNARLRDKANRNLQRINEAYEILRDYSPPPDLRISRVTASLSAILDLGDLMQGAPSDRPPPMPRRPRTRPRRTILGLDLARPAAPPVARTLVRLMLVLVVVTVIALILVLR